MGVANFDKSMDPNEIQVNSSISTIFAMVNSMVGGIILVLPLMVMKSGIIPSFIILGFVGAISCGTFQTLMKNCQPEEFDIQEIVLRIMGKTWMKILNALCSLYLALICVLYYYLIISSLYSISVFSILSIKQDNNQNDGESFCCAKAHEVTFGKFSETYMSIIMLVPMIALLFIKDFKFLVKMSESGIYAIYSYVIFIVYLYIKNMDKIVYYWDNKYLFNFDIGELLGSSLLGFQIQSTSIPIMKFNKNQKKNGRDVSLTFFLATSIYVIIGMLGGLSTLALSNGNLEGKQSILDFFDKTEITPILIEVLYLGHLISVYPIFWQLAKSRAYEIIFGVDHKPPRGIDIAINIIFMVICCLLKNVPAINVSTISEINGAFSCFFLVILIPVCLDIITMKTTNTFIISFKNAIKSIGFNKYYQRNQQHEINEEDGIDNFRHNNNQKEIIIVDAQKKEEIQQEREKHNWVIWYHFFIIFIGLVIMCYSLYNTVEEIQQNISQQESESNHHSFKQNITQQQQQSSQALYNAIGRQIH